MLTPRERSSRTSPRSSHGPRTGWLSPLAPWPAGPQKRLARFSNREYFQSGMLWEKCPPGLGRAAAADRPRLDFACNTETQVRKEGAGVRAKPKERERAPPAKAVRLRVDETLVGECRRRIPSGAKGSPRRRRAPGRQRAERERAREGPRGPSSSRLVLFGVPCARCFWRLPLWRALRSFEARASSRVCQVPKPLTPFPPFLWSAILHSRQRAISRESSWP